MVTRNSRGRINVVRGRYGEVDCRSSRAGRLGGLITREDQRGVCRVGWRRRVSDGDAEGRRGRYVPRLVGRIASDRGCSDREQTWPIVAAVCGEVAIGIVETHSEGDVRTVAVSCLSRDVAGNRDARRRPIEQSERATGHRRRQRRPTQQCKREHSKQTPKLHSPEPPLTAVDPRTNNGDSRRTPMPLRSKPCQERRAVVAKNRSLSNPTADPKRRSLPAARARAARERPQSSDRRSRRTAPAGSAERSCWSSRRLARSLAPASRPQLESALAP